MAAARARRWRAVLVLVLMIASSAVRPPGAEAQLGAVAITVLPLFPTAVQVGAQNQSAALSIANSSTSTSTQPLTITNIRVNPSCSSSFSGILCDPEPRPTAGLPVFAVDSAGVGRSGTACAGILFTVSAPGPTGTVVLAPSAPVVLGPASTGGAAASCVVDFTFDVVQRPNDGQTQPVASAEARSPDGGAVVNTGVSNVTVNAAPTSIVTQAGPSPVLEGTAFTDTAVVTGVIGGPPLSGTVVFRLYRSEPPAFPDCLSAPFTFPMPVAVGATTPDPVTGAPRGIATFTPQPPPPAGNYVFVAHYDEADNDVNYAPAFSACADPSERVTVVPASSVGSRYVPLSPVRIEDTRFGAGTLNGPLGPNATVDVQITGRAGVPANASAVVLNVTVTQPTAEGFLTLYPSGGPRPLAANVNFTPGKTVPNLAVVKVGAGGRVALYNSAGNTHVIFDVAGYYVDDGTTNIGRYQPVVPKRIADTRFGQGGTRLGPGQSIDVLITQGGGPALGVSAAVLNVAATNTTGVSFLTVYPTGEARPLAANLNFNPGDTVSNRTMTKLGAGSRVTIYNNAGETDVVVDLGGTYSDGSVPVVGGAYTPVEPSRVLDTRTGGPIPANGTIVVPVAGRGGVPASGARAVILSVAVTQPAGAGFLTIYPTGVGRPLASDLNYAPGETRANLVVVQLGANGSVDLYTSAQSHVVFDVAGWFS